MDVCPLRLLPLPLSTWPCLRHSFPLARSASGSIKQSTQPYSTLFALALSFVKGKNRLFFSIRLSGKERTCKQEVFFLGFAGEFSQSVLHKHGRGLTNQLFLLTGMRIKKLSTFSISQKKALYWIISGRMFLDEKWSQAFLLKKTFGFGSETGINQRSLHCFLWWHGNLNCTYSDSFMATLSCILSLDISVFSFIFVLFLKQTTKNDIIPEYQKPNGFKAFR